MDVRTGDLYEVTHEMPRSGPAWVHCEDDDEFTRVLTQVTDATTATAIGERFEMHYSALPIDKSIFVQRLRMLRFVTRSFDVETAPIDLVIANGFAVTHGRLILDLEDIRRNVRTLDDPYRLLAALADMAAETAGDVEEEVADAVAATEQKIFQPGAHSSTDPIYPLKRELSEARRALYPMAHRLLAWAAQPQRVEAGIVDSVRLAALAIERSAGQIDSYDRLLSDLLSAVLARQAARQNEDTRRISAWAALLAIPTVATGIYGMNFAHMPELDATWGYPIMLAATAAVVGVLWLIFKRSGWL